MLLVQKGRDKCKYKLYNHNFTIYKVTQVANINFNEAKRAVPSDMDKNVRMNFMCLSISIYLIAFLLHDYHITNGVSKLALHSSS